VLSPVQTLRARKLGTAGLPLKKATLTKGITYSGSLTLEAWAPPTVSPITILHVHGGGWTSSTSCAGFGELYTGSATRNIVYHLVQHGFCVLNIEYSLLAGCTGNTADTTSRQTMITDVLAAMTWARANAATYNGSMTRIAVWGESSGGQLALMAAIQGAAGTTRPDAAVSWSGLTRLDLADGAAPDGIVANYVGVADASQGAGATAAQGVSPYDQWVAGIATPVRLAMYGTDLVRQADGTDMRDKITSVGGTVAYNEVAGVCHADFSGTAEMESAVAWLRARLQ
jgi:acetyl esterase/lipase